MDCDITIKNYRCFPDSHPLRLRMRKGFTAFIGVNNSGKSSAIRFLFELRGLFRELSNPDGIRNAVRGQQAFHFPTTILDNAEIFTNHNERDLTIEVTPLRSTPSGQLVPEMLQIRVPRNTNQHEVTIESSAGRVPQAVNVRAGRFLNEPNNSFPDIDVYDSCELLAQIGNTIYVGPFRNAINIGSNDAYFDLNIGDSFIRDWNNYKAGTIKNNNEAAYRITNDIKQIFGFSDLTIDSASGGKTLQIFVNGRSFKLHEIGSGLTQFIIVLVTAAIRRPAYILIDEPELNLHPSLQLDFLTTLGSYATEGAMFATHCLGLARAAGDAIFSVRSLADGVSEVKSVEDTPRLPEFLGELNYSGYRELGFEKVLLVEGSTEVKTIQQFLRMLKKDHQIVILPLGGSTMIKPSAAAELEEVCRICPHVAALIDSERESAGAQLAKDRAEFAAICGKLGIACHVTDRRATENYLTEHAIQRNKGPKYRALGPFEALNDADPSWAKNENWRIARDMRFDEIEQTDLGKFLAGL